MNHTQQIAENLSRSSGISRRFARSWMAAIFIRALIVLMIILVALPCNQVRACACSEVAVGQRVTTSELSVDEMGELQLPQRDIDLPGVIPVRLTRQYQSANFGTGIFGMGWSVNFVSFMVTLTGDLQINFTGEIQTFKSANSYWNAKKTRQATFTSDNEVTVTDQSGERWIFNTTDGTLKEYTDLNGNKVAYTWNIVTASFMGESTKVYCPLTVTYPGSRTITFTYSATAGMTHLCIQASSPSGFTVSYGYTQNLLTGISKSNGQTLTYSYHTIVNSSHSDWVQGWLNKITYSDGSEVNVTYNGTYTSSATLKVTDISGPLSFDHAYSWSNAEVMTDSLGHTTTSEYTNAGKTIKITDALGNYTNSTKNDLYLTTSFRNKNGKTTTYTYDSSNSNIFAQNNLLSITNPLSKTWTRAYDGNNFLASITDPLGHEISFTNDAKGNLLTVTNGLNQTIKTNTFTTGAIKGLLSSTKNGANNETNYDYNSFGLVSKIIDPAGMEWNYDYSSDGAGNLTKVTTPLGKEWKRTYNKFYKVCKQIDPLNEETHYDYDDMANLTKATDANGNAVEYTWDALQRVTQIKNALGNITGITYDAESNITTLTDALSHTYNYTFDPVNRRKTFSLPDSSQKAYAYDANGNITKITDWGSKEINFAYDNADRRTSKTWEETVNTVFTYTYDYANRLSESTKSAGGSTNSDVSCTYNAANQLTFVTAEGLATGYVYDGAGRISQITYPSGLVTNYTFNARSSLNAIKDASNVSVISYSYDDAGRLIKREFVNGLTCNYIYDDADRVTNIKLCQTSSPAIVVQDFTYGYDKVGNRTYVVYADGIGDVYQYDDAYQLIGVKYGVSNPTAGYGSATGATRTVTYAYDAVGNRTQKTDTASSTVDYAINSLNQYTAVGSNSSYTYDSNGNLAGDGTWAYAYDPENHLISASKSGTIVTYKYDALGHRTQKDVNGTITNYVYSSYNLIEERDISANVTAKYIYEEGIDRPIKVIKGSNVYYFQQDALGNVTALTDGSGNVHESYIYDVYGKPTIKNASGATITTSTTSFLFTGREYDMDTGLYHYRARAYSSDLGRFISRDPIGERGGINLYRYASNNPVNKIDPLGLEDSCTDCKDKPKQGNGVAMKCCVASPVQYNDDPNPYPSDYTYMGVSASKMFEDTGTNDWSNSVRGCLSCMYSHGADATVSHAFCYVDGTVRNPLRAAGGLGDAVGNAINITIGN